MIGGEDKLHIAGRTLDLDTKLLAHNSAQGPQLDTMPPVKARKMFRLMTSVVKGKLDASVEVSEFSIPVDEQEIDARLYSPKDLSSQTALIIYFHGGGNVIGDLDSYEVLASDFTAHLNLRTLNVDYRLAPEHKFPTAANDAYAAYLWARENADKLNINPDEIILAGDSAGGYLSSVVSLQALENNKPLPKGQVLIYPMTDISKERESLQLFAEGLILTKSMMNYFISHYINDENDRTNPLMSPLLATDEQLAKMPPTIITLAGFDPLYDEGKAFYEKLKRLNVNVRLIEHLDLTHGFITMTGVLKRGQEAKNNIIKACSDFFNI